MQYRHKITQQSKLRFERGSLALALLAGLSVFAARPAAAQYAYPTKPTTFDINVANANNTELHGVNDSGTFVGTYTDGNEANQGFIVNTPTAVTSVSGPAASASKTVPYLEINKINNAGQYVGDYEVEDKFGTNTPQGFTGSGGTVTGTALPYSAAYDINNLGVSVGAVLSSDGINFQSYLGTGGGGTAFDVPGYSTSQATGINDSGVIVGQANTDTTTGPTVSYIKSGDTFSFLSLPGTGALDIYVTDINNAGTIVGSFDTTANGPTTGFVDFGGVITTFPASTAFPESNFYSAGISSEVDGINNLGEIVGTYTNTDTSGFTDTHGFYAMPVPEASTMVSLGILLILGLGGIARAKKKQMFSS